MVEPDARLDDALHNASYDAYGAYDVYNNDAHPFVHKKYRKVKALPLQQLA